MRRIVWLLLLLPLLLLGPCVALADATRAGLIVRRRVDGSGRTAEYFRGGRFMGRVTVHADGRMVLEHAVHDARSPALRITTYVTAAAGARRREEPIRILEWNRSGDWGGMGKIRYYVDGRRDVEGSGGGPLR